MTTQVRIGVDTGGTFTDFVLVIDGSIHIHKQFSTPADPSNAIISGLASLSISKQANVIHGTTVATNALLEKRGARTALLTTAGFSDILEIGRQDRPRLYDLQPSKPEPLIPTALRLEVQERVHADGSIGRTLTSEHLTHIIDWLQQQRPDSVAISLIFSFLNPTHEQLIRAEIAKAFGGSVATSLSSDILPEYREYERTSTTVINAYVSPIMHAYLESLTSRLGDHTLHIMQSNGGLIPVGVAQREAARTALSGPAGGAVGALFIGQQANQTDLITFDMGGTSTDVALLPGQIPYTQTTLIRGMPLRLPTADIHTVGAGGGSIAWVDNGGALRVGPQSAGADPGPAAYGNGIAATTTDANLILGRLQPDRFLDGTVTLHLGKAKNAIQQLADQLADGASTEQTAWGIIQVANAVMARAIRKVSVEQGHDPRYFTLIAFGGAGPLHACDLADLLSIPRVLIPRYPGVLSALGMVVADAQRDYSESALVTLRPAEQVASVPLIGTIVDRLTQTAISDLEAAGFSGEDIMLQPALDMRYRGQSHEILIRMPSDETWVEAFHAEHDRLYGHQRLDAQIEIVTVRLFATGRRERPSFEQLSSSSEPPISIADGDVWFAADGPTSTTLYNRAALHAGQTIAGPSLLFQLDTTIVIPPGWVGQIDTWGNLLLEHGA